MFDAINTGLSGMRAADAMLATTANNIANLNTPGYRASRVSFTALPHNSGVALNGPVTDSAPTSDSLEAQQTSDVDLPTQLVTTIQAKTLYNANAMVVKTADQMLGSLLDILDTDNGKRSNA